jgi:hypothetical protein
MAVNLTPKNWAEVPEVQQYTNADYFFGIFSGLFKRIKAEQMRGKSVTMNGAYSPTATYVNNAQRIDLVSYNGSTYGVKASYDGSAVAVVDVPPENTMYWELWAEKGSTGNAFQGALPEFSLTWQTLLAMNSGVYSVQRMYTYPFGIFPDGFVLVNNITYPLLVSHGGSQILSLQIFDEAGNSWIGVYSVGTGWSGWQRGGGGGIVIPNIRVIPSGYGTTRGLFISCNFPDWAEFLKHNPRIVMYRKIKHSSYDRRSKLAAVTSPEEQEKTNKYFRNKEMGFVKPAHAKVNSYSGNVMYSTFPFEPPNANHVPIPNYETLRVGSNYRFPLCIKYPDRTELFTPEKIIEMFGIRSLVGTPNETLSLSRCSRQSILAVKGTPGKISLTLGFALRTDLGESKIATVRFKVESWHDMILGAQLSPSFEVMD